VCAKQVRRHARGQWGVILVSVGEILAHPLCSKWLAMCMDDVIHSGDVVA
jgi:hypothetical protein